MDLEKAGQDRKFRYKPQVHLALLFIIAIMVYFAVKTMTATQELGSTIIYIVCFVVFTAAVLDSLFTYYQVSDEGLLLKSLLKSTFIRWDEINEINKQSGASLVTETIGIYSRKDKITVTRWTQGYLALLSCIVDRCKCRDDVNIDCRVTSLLNRGRVKRQA